jgi:hypothetical protein
LSSRSPAGFLSPTLASDAYVDVPRPLAGGLFVAGLLLRLRLAGRSPSRLSPGTIALARNSLESVDRRQPTPRDRRWAAG